MKKAVGYLIPFMEEERQKRLAGHEGDADKSLKVRNKQTNKTQTNKQKVN